MWALCTALFTLICFMAFFKSAKFIWTTSGNIIERIFSMIGKKINKLLDKIDR